jgi:nitronate monooxygenase
MGFVALPALVAAVSEAGGLGVLGVAPEPPPVFAERLTQIRALTSRPFGVDFFLTTSPTLGPITVDDHIAIAAAAKVDLAVFHFAIPTAAWVSSLKAAGSRIWVQVPTVDFARQALAAGADGLVVQGKEAGGHNRSTTPLHHLLHDVRHELGDDVLLLAAGGISTGADVVAALAHGADGVWVGTRLVASTEAYAHPGWKQRIVEAKSHDTVITKLFGPELPCQPYRVLRNPAIDAAIGRQDELCALPPRARRSAPPSSSQAPPLRRRESPCPPSAPSPRRRTPPGTSRPWACRPERAPTRSATSSPRPASSPILWPRRGRSSAGGAERLPE